MVKMKQLALAIALLVFMGRVAGHAYAQVTLDQRIDELSKQISDGLTENQKQTIAVVEFVDLKGRVTDLGRFLAEKLITRLYQTKKFKVIERQLLNKIVNEQKLSLTGMIDQSTAQRLGKLLGVDAIASGTVTDLGKRLDINARLINTQTGEIFAVASVEITKDDSVLKLMEGGDVSNANDANTQPEQKGIQKLDVQSFTFDLVQCTRSSGTIACDLLITNNDVERQLTFENRRNVVNGTVMPSGNSVLYDNLGNSHRWRAGQIANSATGAVLVSGVPTKARITFDDIPSQVTSCSLVSLSFEILKVEPVRVLGSSRVFKVEFRNVPLRGQRGN
jgi:curli biogenesis system outer membrane secretion channel CsgG